MRDALWTALASAGPRFAAATWGRRWTIVGRPEATFRIEPSAGGAHSRWIVEGREAEPPVRFAHDPIADLRAVLEWGSAAWGGRDLQRPACPFVGGWLGFFSYELGRVIEPAVGQGPPAAPGGGPCLGRPLVELHWCPRAAAIERESGMVEAIGAGPVQSRQAGGAFRGFTIGPLSSATGRAGFVEAVERAVEYIRAGDVFQVNLAHRLSAPFAGSTRALFAALCGAADPWHGMYLEAEGRALVSASPELFLRVEPRPDGSARVVTRPMKGTRPASADPGELERSGKDRAELNMIVDLMRNDLGRVCRVGSVKVEEARRIERHGGGENGGGGVWQGVATLSGELPPGKGIADLIGACFPAGSVTGAPKIRAMQIIDELEPVRRGPYCGSAGWIGMDGAAELSVLIRTALVSGEPGSEPGTVERGVLDYSVGAGIVAESDPAAEWEETLDKAGILRAVASHSRGEPRAAHPWHPAAPV